jgi:carbamoyl-phosphate synthase small subunit
MNRVGYLVLEDGTVFEGSVLTEFENVGEVVFNTSHSGYEEMSTDPSYAKQIMVTTAPMQGNYGVSKEVWESESVHFKGFISLQMQKSERDSGWLELLRSHKVSVLEELDTRTLTLYLREKGSLWGGVFLSDNHKDSIEKIKIEKQKHLNKDWTKAVSTQEPYTLESNSKNKMHIGALDFGCKKNIIRELLKTFSKVTVLPASSSAEHILNQKFDGLMLSNGPGDPADVKEPLEEIKKLLGQLPIMGICMGHQLLGLALGGKTFKLKFGHRGANHPIKDAETSQVFMSSQNHGYALTETFEGHDVSITHYNLNDKSVAGIRCSDKNAFSVQFHPEHCPGPEEGSYLFEKFLELILGFKKSMSTKGLNDRESRHGL